MSVWLTIFGCSPQALLPQGQSSEPPSFSSPNGTGMPQMSMVPSRTFSHPTPKIPNSGRFLCFCLIFSLPLEAGTSCTAPDGSCHRQEARGTALGPCYILFQKAIADISTTYTTARDILCYKGFQKHKPPELNTYSMASGALESSGTRMQSLAGAEAMQCLTDRGENCKSFLNLVSLIVLLDGFAQKVFSVGWIVFVWVFFVLFICF